MSLTFISFITNQMFYTKGSKSDKVMIRLRLKLNKSEKSRLLNFFHKEEEQKKGKFKIKEN